MYDTGLRHSGADLVGNCRCAAERVEGRLGGGYRGRNGEVLALVARVHVARSSSAAVSAGWLARALDGECRPVDEKQRFPTTKRKSPMQWPHHFGTAVAAAATTAAATVPTHPAATVTVGHTSRLAVVLAVASAVRSALFGRCDSCECTAITSGQQ
jgi:hypothetical protein